MHQAGRPLTSAPWGRWPIGCERGRNKAGGGSMAGDTQVTDWTRIVPEGGPSDRGAGEDFSRRDVDAEAHRVHWRGPAARRGAEGVSQGVSNGRRPDGGPEPLGARRMKP